MRHHLFAPRTKNGESNKLVVVEKIVQYIYYFATITIIIAFPHRRHYDYCMRAKTEKLFFLHFADIDTATLLLLFFMT